MASLARLGPLPPIDATVAPTATSAPKRSAEEQASLEAELDEMHELLGVREPHSLFARHV